MATPRIVKAFNAVVNGTAYPNMVTEATLPNVELLTEEHRGGAMDMPIEVDLGMAAMVSSLSFDDYDPGLLKAFGLTSGDLVRIQITGTAEDDDGTCLRVRAEMFGKVKMVDRGTWAPGQKNPLSIEMALRYYKEEADGDLVYEIDPLNHIRTVDGVDQLAKRRGALNLA